MIGMGGSALVSKTMGEGDDEKANNLFSLLVYLAVILGIVISAVGVIFVPQVAVRLGAQGEMIENCVVYGRIYLLALPLFMLQYVFQSFLVVAGKSEAGTCRNGSGGCDKHDIRCAFYGSVPSV